MHEGQAHDLARARHPLEGLTALDLAAIAAVETSNGTPIQDGFTWTPGTESSHHRDGTLTLAEPALAGAAWLRLTIPAVAGVGRTFEWEASLLAHDLP